MRHWLFVAVLAFVPIANAEDYRTNCSPAAGGYQVHDYTKYQPTRAKVLKDKS